MATVSEVAIAKIDRREVLTLDADMQEMSRQLVVVMCEEKKFTPVLRFFS